MNTTHDANSTVQCGPVQSLANSSQADAATLPRSNFSANDDEQEPTTTWSRKKHNVYSEQLSRELHGKPHIHLCWEPDELISVGSFGQQFLLPL